MNRKAWAKIMMMTWGGYIPAFSTIEVNAIAVMFSRCKSFVYLDIHLDIHLYIITLYLIPPPIIIIIIIICLPQT